LNGPVDVTILVRRAGAAKQRLTRDIVRAAHAAATVRRKRLPSLSIVVVGDRRMRALNRDFHDVDATTDVLAFPHRADDEPDDLGAEARGTQGEVIVCAPVAARQGPRHGVDPRWELLLYVVHGVLHLLGEEDHQPAAAARMRRLERRALQLAGYDLGEGHLMPDKGAR